MQYQFFLYEYQTILHEFLMHIYTELVYVLTWVEQKNETIHLRNIRLEMSNIIFAHYPSKK